MMIECASLSARFVVSETTFVSMKRLHFICCGSNTVTRVEELVVKDIIFQGVEGEGKGTALVLDEVTFAEIIKSYSFPTHLVTTFNNTTLEIKMNSVVAVCTLSAGHVSPPSSA